MDCCSFNIYVSFDTAPELLVFINKHLPERLGDSVPSLSKEKFREIFKVVFQEFDFYLFTIAFFIIGLVLFFVYTFVIIHNCIKNSKNWKELPENGTLMKLDRVFFRNYLITLAQIIVSPFIYGIGFIAISIFTLLPIGLVYAFSHVSSFIVTAVLILGIGLFLIYISLIVYYMTAAFFLFYRDLNVLKFFKFVHVYKCIKTFPEELFIVAIINMITLQLAVVFFNITIELFPLSFWKLSILLVTTYILLFTSILQGQNFVYLDHKFKEKGL